MTSFSLSIDGVGVWSLRGGHRWSVGGPGSGADLEFLAPLGKRAAEVTYEDGRYRLRVGDGPEAGDRRAGDGPGGEVLRDGQSFSPGGGVELRFRQPHPWSRAVTLVSVGPRPADGSDGLVLWSGPCVLGPQPDSHVVCREWGEAVALFRWQDGPRWRRVDPLAATQEGNPGGVNRLTAGTLIETEAGRVLVGPAD